MNAVPEQVESASGPAILVIYYSRTGTTRRVAERIAERLGADLEEIADVYPRRGLVGYLRSWFDAFVKRTPAIEVHRAPEDYDLVVIGTPIWNGTMAAPVRSYLLETAARLPKTAFFSTSRSLRAEPALTEMASLVGARRPVTYWATRASVAEDRFNESLAPFLDRIQRGFSQSPKQGAPSLAHEPPAPAESLVLSPS